MVIRMSADDDFRQLLTFGRLGLEDGQPLQIILSAAAALDGFCHAQHHFQGKRSHCFFVAKPFRTLQFHERNS
jgi:hypothetical protein